MSKSRILVSLIVLLCIAFTVFQFKEIQWLSDYSRSLIVPVITILFFVKFKPKLCCFALFLVLFSVAELMTLIEFSIPLEWYVLFYAIGNGLYIVAYGVLTYEILRYLSLSAVVKNFAIHLVVLTGLNLYILYVLHNIITPYLEINLEFVIELSYNIIILTLLSAALLNYLYRDNKKSLLLFLGTLSIVFSEVIQIAFLYIEEKKALDIAYTILLVLAFYFLYIQTKFKNDEVPLMIQKEAL